MRIRESVYRVVVPVILASQAAVVAPLHAQSPESAPLSLCRQAGGTVECQRAVAGPWMYRVKDLNNDFRYSEESDAYAYLLRISSETAVFSLIYRWGTADHGGYPTRKIHSIESSSWKVYQRCSPDEPFDCNAFPKYVAYQRSRKVACPDGYRFSSDADSPYCLPVGFMDQQVASLAKGPKRR